MSVDSAAPPVVSSKSRATMGSTTMRRLVLPDMASEFFQAPAYLIFPLWSSLRHLAVSWARLLALA